MVFKQKTSLLLRRQLYCGNFRGGYPLYIELTDALPFDAGPGIFILGNDLFAVQTYPLLLAKLQLAKIAAAMATGLAREIPLTNEDEILPLHC